MIDVAYADLPEEKRERLKWYKLYVLPREKKRSGGMYYYNENRLEVYNPRLGSDFMASTLIHELSHRMSYQFHGSAGTGHGKEFYAEYTRLIYAALDMGILTEDTFTNDTWSSDKNKVRKIISKYKPNPVEYTMNFPPVVKVYNAYSIKEDLKTRGYTWNTIELLWEKETDNTEDEAQFLENIGVINGTGETDNNKQMYYQIDESSLFMKPVIYIETKGDTYNAREKLKEMGFIYSSKDKKWICKVNASEYAEKLNEAQQAGLQGIEFKPMNRNIKRK